MNQDKYQFIPSGECPFCDKVINDEDDNEIITKCPHCDRSLIE